MSRKFPGDPVVRTLVLSLPSVQSLVKELRSRKPPGAAKTNKTTKQKTSIHLCFCPAKKSVLITQAILATIPHTESMFL